MSQLEYLIALVSIIVGLGLTDLARSLRELVRPGRTVHWHWLPLTWAAIAFLVIVQIWWQSFRFLQKEALAHAAVFTPVLLGFLLLYLICAFALPDPDRTRLGTEGGRTSDSQAALDLEAFYFSAAHGGSSGRSLGCWSPASCSAGPRGPCRTPRSLKLRAWYKISR
ncbi:hypothetical protein [Salinibacter altiplanensis]|uniref:hypothetical protein n=1 Tax=Salinibacter altiplanensis TaxID=1803181 RepID=UPI001F48E977|nr:hypothetical protein [Salinibacter altiplanensis]